MNDFIITHVLSSAGEDEYKPAIRYKHRGKQKKKKKMQ